MSGYSTQQEVELFRVKASQYQPDLVIVGYCLNDYGESSVEGEAFRRLYFDIFSKSYLYDHLRRNLTGLSDRHLGITITDPEKQFDLHRQFELLQSYCQDRTSVVVIFPMLENFASYVRMHEHERVRLALEGLNYEVLDLFYTFKEYRPSVLQVDPRDKTHPNELGTRLAAQRTAEFLAQAELLPATAAAGRE